MTNVDKLRKEELEALNTVEVSTDEFNLEDLIILGDDKKIPIHIIYPNNDGTRSKAKALVKQLTLKELDNIKSKGSSFEYNLIILQKGLFKQNGEPFTKSELKWLPIGVVNAVSNKILELSGVDIPDQPKLQDF